jgi:hypothetical protein
VYVIRSERGPVKVGVASNVRRRLHGLRVGSPARLSLEFEGECESTNVREIEAKAHALLASSRENGEWFSVSVDAAVHAVIEAASQLGYEMRRLSTCIQPRANVVGTPVMIRFQPELLAYLDKFRREQPDLPNRPEAIRRIIEAARKKAR